MPPMKIGELASATGLSRDTLRFYEKRGLLQSRRRKLADIDACIAALGALRTELARELDAPGSCPLRQ